MNELLGRFSFRSVGLSGHIQAFSQRTGSLATVEETDELLIVLNNASVEPETATEPPDLIDYSKLNDELIEENRQKTACDLVEQLCVDLNQAHDEICRIVQGATGQVAAADWPECSSQANSIRAAERLLGKRLAKTNNWSEFQDKAAILEGKSEDV